MDKDTPIPQPAENDAGFLNILEVITLSDKMKQKYSCLRPACYVYLVCSLTISSMPLL